MNHVNDISPIKCNENINVLFSDKSSGKAHFKNKLPTIKHNKNNENDDIKGNLFMNEIFDQNLKSHVSTITNNKNTCISIYDI